MTTSDSPQVRTMYRDGQWCNEQDGEGDPVTFGTKAEAQAAGRDLARSASAEHLIYTRDGDVGERHRYQGDSLEGDGPESQDAREKTRALWPTVFAVSAGGILLLIAIIWKRKRATPQPSSRMHAVVDRARTAATGNWVAKRFVQARSNS